MQFSAAISGGGICGLATATALAQRGWKTTVFESRPNLRVSGSGIYMHNTPLDIMAKLGAFDRATQNAFELQGTARLNNDGEWIYGGPRPAGSRVIAIPRSDLLAGLEQAAREAGVEIVTSAEVVDARADGSLIFANGNRVQADLAIGADGVWSPVRRALGLEESHVRTTDGALRTIIRATQDDIPENMRGYSIAQWSGRRFILITPINDQEIYLGLVCPAVDEEGRDTSVRPVWAESFPMWKHLIDRVEGPMIWGVFSVMKCKSWSAGRTCILGDSAHATTPNLGSGGGLAMENGMALAAYMAKVTDPLHIPAALAAWEAAVRPHTERTQYWSSMMGEFTNVSDEARPRIIRAVTADPWVQEQVAMIGRKPPLFDVDWAPA